MPGDYSVFWFVSCLFLTQQMMNILLVKLKNVTVLVILLVFILASYLISSYQPHFDLPLDALVVLASSPFFFAGHSFRQWPVLRVGWLHLLSYLGVAVAICLLLKNIRISYDMHTGHYGVPLLSLILSLCCILAVIFVSCIASSIPSLFGFLRPLGTLSMGIMFIHNQLFLPHKVDSLIPPGSILSFLLIFLVSFIITYCFSRVRLTRALFLGSELDYHALFGRWPVHLNSPLS